MSTPWTEDDEAEQQLEDCIARHPKHEPDLSLKELTKALLKLQESDSQPFITSDPNFDNSQKLFEQGHKMVVALFNKNDPEYIDLGAETEYECPQCGQEPDEHYGEVFVAEDGHLYPRYLHEDKWSNQNGTIHDWIQVEFCPMCRIKYHFSNGAY